MVPSDAAQYLLQYRTMFVARFARITAVRRSSLFTLDADRINRHGPRIVDEIAVLCEAIEGAR